MNRIVLTKSQIRAMASSVEEDFRLADGKIEFAIEDSNLHNGTTRSLEMVSAGYSIPDSDKAILISKNGDRMELKG